jgi:hypothetical protein
MQVYQHLYLAFLYGLLKVKSVLVDDFAALAKGCIGELRLARMTPGEAFMFWACKVRPLPSPRSPLASE